jgi:hypothetical protein
LPREDIAAPQLAFEARVEAAPLPCAAGMAAGDMRCVAPMAEAEPSRCAGAGRCTACAVRVGALSPWEPAIAEESGMVPSGAIGAAVGGLMAWVPCWRWTDIGYVWICY